jgi:hypothetical protein
LYIALVNTRDGICLTSQKRYGKEKLTALGQGAAILVIEGKPYGDEHAEADAGDQRTQNMEYERPADHVVLSV